MDVDVGGLNLRRPELRTRLSNIGERSGAAVIAVFGKLQGALRGLDRIVEQPALRIGRPQLEVIDRQFRRQGEPRSFEIGGRGPCPLETKQLDNLPPITRSFSDLAALTPGLLVGVGTKSSANISINNAPVGRTGYLLDGHSNETTSSVDNLSMSPRTGCGSFPF